MGFCVSAIWRPVTISNDLDKVQDKRYMKSKILKPIFNLIIRIFITSHRVNVIQSVKRLNNPITEFLIHNFFELIL